MTKVIITGGAGYLGTAFLKYHTGAYDITVFDNLLYGGDALIPYFHDVNFHFIKGDVRDHKAVREAIKDKDVIIHLAAIVGLPACEADMKTAEEVNYESSFNIAVEASRNYGQRVLYASTVSVYGKIKDDICTEKTYARPLSHYGQTKIRAESALVDYCKATSFRFPTAFGVAPRMRIDLMPNDLTFQAVKNGGAVVYEPEARRSFIHVRDVTRAFEFAINKYDTQGQVYNPGDESLNITKRGLAELIAKETGAKFHFADIGHDGDHRDYEVSFEKIKSLGFRTGVSLEQGIKEVAQAARVMNVRNPYTNI
jgi:nucleoside-diphosphate-sugar epimerase